VENRGVLICNLRPQHAAFFNVVVVIEVLGSIAEKHRAPQRGSFPLCSPTALKGKKKDEIIDRDIPTDDSPRLIRFAATWLRGFAACFAECRSPIFRQLWRSSLAAFLLWELDENTSRLLPSFPGSRETVYSPAKHLR